MLQASDETWGSVWYEATNRGKMKYHNVATTVPEQSVYLAAPYLQERSI
jgi:hypothetical protein